MGEPHSRAKPDAQGVETLRKDTGSGQRCQTDREKWHKTIQNLESF